MIDPYLFKDMYTRGYSDAIACVMHMFNREHEWYQELWKNDAPDEDMRKSEEKLVVINNVICELLTQRQKALADQKKDDIS